MKLIVRRSDASPAPLQRVEVVERKGLGHPDTICDGIAEEISVRLCRHYLERFGAILHHNVDKVLLCGGASRPSYGGGEVLEPIEIYVAGRATDEHRGEKIPVHEIAARACREWLSAHVPMLDVDRHVKIVSRIRPGSTDLVALYGGAASNDTSCGTGFAPLGDLEKVVLEVERTLNDAEVKRKNPAIGTDVKVMGVRVDEHVDLTISCALVGRFVADLGNYLAQKKVVRELAIEAARRVTRLDVDARVNAGDDPKTGDVFLTVTGTSAEAGDDGETGRGNRACGLITPYRAMSVEAAAGKNPVTHVGKLYNLLASRIATRLVESGGARHADCVLVSQIGRPVKEPQIADVQLPRDAPLDERRVREIVASELDHLDTLRDDLLAQRIRLY